MVKRYVFVQDVTKDDWDALPRNFKAGEFVKEGSDSYGLCRDDMIYGGFETVSCTCDSGQSYFTVPVRFLRTPDGASVRGEYTCAVSFLETYNHF